MENKIGALWEKTSKKNGKEYFSGNIEINGEKTQIVVFKNDKSGVETRPDYQIFKSEERQTTNNEVDVESIPF